MADIRMQEHGRDKPVIFPVPDQVQDAERPLRIQNISFRLTSQKYQDIHCRQNRAAPGYPFRMPPHLSTKLLCPHISLALFLWLIMSPFKG